jgi:uncharacterized protein (TIGR03118 family)
MQKIFQQKINLLPTISVMVLFLFVCLQACRKLPHSPGFDNDFQQVNLVANNSNYGAVTVDPTFVNGWGIAFASSGPAWVSAEGTGLSTIYNAAGAILRAPVTIPTNGASTGGSPTGQVFNGTTGFRLSNGKAARFIFAGTDGVISGWNTGNAAELAKANAGAVYTGLTLATDAGVPFLYAANFSGKKIDVFDTLWNKVSKPFWDHSIPSDYAPFNVQAVGGKIYVLYAKIGKDMEEAKGPGLGIIDIYNPDGSLLRRFASRGALNAPWGITGIPASFLTAPMNTGAVILVGNFGDGRINAYSENGQLLGPLRSNGKPIVIDGLWALSFAPATATSVNPNWLFFAAGPKDEMDGLFGYITPEMPDGK